MLPGCPHSWECLSTHLWKVSSHSLKPILKSLSLGKNLLLPSAHSCLLSHALMVLYSCICWDLTLLLDKTILSWIANVPLCSFWCEALFFTLSYAYQWADISLLMTLSYGNGWTEYSLSHNFVLFKYLENDVGSQHIADVKNVSLSFWNHSGSY